jgi:hypothetical protein
MLAKLLTLCAALWCVPAIVRAQGAPPPADVPAQVAAIERIAWLAGEWEGEADWNRGPDGQARVVSWERVTRAAGGAALMIFGRHYERQADGSRGKMVHDAAGMITWDTRTGRYRFNAQLGNGQYGTFDGEAEGGARDATFIWRIVTPQGVVRYRIERDADRRWRERGAFCPPGEKPDVPCRPFFDMTLVRKGD